MRRLMSVATRSGCSRATSRADWPTTASPSAGSRTALGVSISPSRLGSVTGWPWSSSVATAQNVVPRSMPTSFPVPAAMSSTFGGRGDGNGNGGGAFAAPRRKSQRELYWRRASGERDGGPWWGGRSAGA